ncbi:MAG: hypothetical protein Q9180_007975 [Flavoplaca navasiana]
MADPRNEPYSVGLADSELYENVTYAIGQVHFSKVPGHRTRAYTEASEETQKHVSLMDHVALLLVYKPTADVVATGLVREQNGFTIAYSKNQGYTPSTQETNYIVTLRNAFKELEQPIKILRIVAGMCRLKILARAKKLVAATAATAAVQSNNFFGVIEHARTEDMRQFLVRRQLMRNQSLSDGLDSFLAATRGLGSSSDPDVFVRVLAFAYWLSLHESRGNPKLDSVPGVNPILFWRVKKLGAYYNACLKIHFAARKLSPSVRFNISTRQLHPPSIQPFRPFSNTLKALNTWTARYGLAPFEDFSVVENFYPNAHPGAFEEDARSNIQATQHCELTIGLQLWQRNKSKGMLSNVEIGCSKQSCFYCSLYIEKFNEWAYNQNTSSRLIVRGQHNKYVQGWAMPKGPDSVTKNVLNGIGQAMQEIYVEAGGPRRRSDSQSPPSKTEKAEEAATLDQIAMSGSQGLF